MPRVLLVANDPAIAQPLVRLMANAGASQVDWAETAERALHLAAFTDHELVVADFDLGPGIGSGIAALERLRQLKPDRPAHYVVMTTGRDTVPAWCDVVDVSDLDRLALWIRAWPRA